MSITRPLSTNISESLTDSLVTWLFGAEVAGGNSSILFFDDFLTELAAPISGSRTAEPGPGTSNIIDSANTLFINSSGGLVWTKAGLPNTSTDPRLDVDSGFAFQPTPGKIVGMLWSRTSLDRSYVLRLLNESGSLIRSLKPEDGSVSALRIAAEGGEYDVFNGPNDGVEASTPYYYAFIDTGTGYMVLVKGGSNFPNWTLAFTFHMNRPNTETLVPRITNFNSYFEVDSLEIRQNNNFDNCWAAAEYVNFIPETGAFTHSSDSIFQLNWTPATGEVLEARFRRTDDDNCWLLEADQASGQLRLSTVSGGTVSGVSGSPVSQAFSTNSSYRIITSLRGQNIMIWADDENVQGNSWQKYTLTGQIHQENVANGTWTVGSPETVNDIICYPVTGFSGTDFESLTPNNKHVESNDNLFLMISDVHMEVSDNGSTFTNKSRGVGLAHYLNGFGAAGLVNMGDNGERFGNSDDYQGYKDHFWDLLKMPKAHVRGNHDADTDTVSPNNGPSTFTSYNAIFGEVYNETIDWANPQIRFICFHVRPLHYDETGGPGEFACDADVRSWVSGELNNLPTGWKAVLCSHCPQDVVGFTNNLNTSQGGSALAAIVSGQSSKIAACFAGHRHQSMHKRTDENGIPHWNVPNVNAVGVDRFSVMEFDGTDTITVKIRDSTSLHAPVRLDQYDASPTGFPSFTI